MSSILDLPDTGALVSSLDDVGVHCTGWYQLSPTVEITRLPLWDSRHQLAARPGWKPAEDWMRARGWRPVTVAEMRALHAVGKYVAPFTLPTITMIRAAIATGELDDPWMTKDGRDTAKMRRYRSAHMRSHRWCAMHDRDVFERLTRAGWDGRQPVPNFGKQLTAGGIIFGWLMPDGTFIQGPSPAHANQPLFGDYASTIFAARDVARGSVQVPPGTPAPPASSEPTPTKLGDRGAPVLAWQRHLLVYGGEPARLIVASGGADGVHGPGTERATEAWRVDQTPTRDDLPALDAGEPPIVTCAAWGARPAIVQPTSPAVGIVLHHMALGSRSTATVRRRGTLRTPGATYEAELEAAKALARSVQASHQAGRDGKRGTADDWVDTGQHFSVSRGGIILEGRTGALDAARRGLVVAGAHAGSAANRDHWGIEFEGDYTVGSHYGDTTPEMPEEQWNAGVWLVSWLLRTGALSADAIRGHRQVPGNATGCPGTLLDRLPELRAAVRA